MKCFVINLDRSSDRLAHIGKEFERIGVAFVRVPGVDGRLLSRDDIAAIADPIQRWRFPLTSAEIGCFLSHRKCLQLAAEGQDAYAAIFEDDIALEAKSARFLNRTDWIPPDADVVKLETHGREVLLDSFAPGPVAGTRIARLRSKHMCAGGYIVSRATARRIVARMGLMSVPIDSLVFDPDFDLAGTLAIYQVVPALCVQAGLQSLITPDRKQVRPDAHRPSFPVRTVRKIARRARRLFLRLTRYSLEPRKLWVTLSTAQTWMRVPFEDALPGVHGVAAEPWSEGASER